MNQISLTTVIYYAIYPENKPDDIPSDLTEEQRQALWSMLAKGCRSKNSERLGRIIMGLPVSLWPSDGIVSRIKVEDGKLYYITGQSYPEEIATLRNVFLGK